MKRDIPELRIQRVKRAENYDFYEITDVKNRVTVYNIVPIFSKPPVSGYHSKTAIEALKGVKF